MGPSGEANAVRQIVSGLNGLSVSVAVLVPAFPAFCPHPMWGAGSRENRAARAFVSTARNRR